jgi:hypothetical protein
MWTEKDITQQSTAKDLLFINITPCKLPPHEKY